MPSAARRGVNFMRNYLTIGGKPSTDFGIYISGVGIYDAPERDVTQIEVPGRNGDLIYDNGRFRNVEIHYPCYIVNEFAEHFNGFKQYMYSDASYRRLEDTYDLDHYRLAQFKGPLTPDLQILHRTGAFDLSFTCDPRRFLKSSDYAVTLTESSMIFNPTYFKSKPLLRVYGTGSFTIGDIEVTISSADVYTDIDCELLECYKGSTNCNGNVTCDSFSDLGLESGENTIMFDGITQLDITPRYWEI